ncbi:unnamed protein product [Rotaria sp. Silwood2]|nr:unnamed protein product [Rotaria sp. Silwood2]
MVRKKSTAAKAKTRKKAYERRKTQDRVSHSWRKLLLIATAANKFLRFRRCDIALTCSTSDSNKSQSNKIFLNNVSFVQKDIEFRYVNKTNATNHLEDLNVVQATIKKRSKSYLNKSLSTEKDWICKTCSDKIKKGQIPSRAIVNKLEVSEIPSELKRLNNLEKHLIALRLPFMKIVNLTSGKLSSRFAQKGTKGPLHCVPSDVQDTVTILPRPVDKSMMVRLQLKRRLKYKAVWEEQLINSNDVRDALFVLTKMHPGYKNIKINDIHENYLTSDQEKYYDNNFELIVEPMDVETISEETDIEQTEVSNENNLKRLALGDIDNNIDSDEEINEDEQDIRTKYNIGTDSCTQPCDFNDFLVFDKEPCVVAPAEKN